MIRFILVALFVILFLICSIPILIVEYFIGKFNMDVKNHSSLAIVNWAFRVCLFISGTKVTVIGEENVPKDAAVLYVGNHRSYFDILITYVRVPRPTGYVAKKEMLRYPLLRDWMRYLHCLFLDRKDLKQGMKTIMEGIEKVKSGISICIFPEGTRNKDSVHPEKLLTFKDGSFKIAQKTGCKIVPIAIKGTAEIFEDHLPWIKSHPVTVSYGAPIELSSLSKEDSKHLGAYAQNIVLQMLSEMD